MGNMQYRAFSSEGLQAFDKLKGALEQYRVDNYSQCIPTRFKKDIVRAAKDSESEHVAIDGLEKVIVNIGASDKVSRYDMEIIFSEIRVGSHFYRENVQFALESDAKTRDGNKER